MKTFATFGKIGDEFELVAGPNSDYESQSGLVKAASTEGSEYEQIILVDLGRGTVKRRRPAKIEKPAKASKKKDQP